MSFIKKALCAAAVGGLALSSPAIAAPKAAAVKVASKDVRAASKAKKAQRAIGGEQIGIIIVGGAVVVAGAVALASSSS